MSFCIGCGECCNYVMITKDEAKRIKNYIKLRGIKVKESSSEIAECKFLNENKQCDIYSARPHVCKIFGKYENLKCDNYKGDTKGIARPGKVKGLTFINDLK